MKTLIFLLSISLISSILRAADSPPELSQARKRYETAVAAATKPLRERYVQELQQIKSRALSLRNLELAMAAENEIKEVIPRDSATEMLCSHIWSLGPDKLEFVRTGELIQHGTGWVGKDWQLSKDGRQVTIKFTNGNGGTFKFEHGKMTHFNGTPYERSPKP